MAITVRVTDLLEKINELIKDGIEYVEVGILDEQEFDGEKIPASLHFEAYDGHGGGVDYEDIEEVKVSATYKFDNILDVTKLKQKIYQAEIKMSKYVIHLTTESLSYPRNEYGYWTGKTYTFNKELFPICDSLVGENTKRYKSKKVAESSAAKIHEKCSYVMKWIVEEIQ